MTFSSFNFSQATLDPDDYTPDGQEPVREWLDGCPRMGGSSDGFELLLHLPSGLLSGPKVRVFLYIF